MTGKKESQSDPSSAIHASKRRLHSAQAFFFSEKTEFLLSTIPRPSCIMKRERTLLYGVTRAKEEISYGKGRFRTEPNHAGH
jgi:hypothetical protein